MPTLWFLFLKLVVAKKEAKHEEMENSIQLLQKHVQGLADQVKDLDTQNKLYKLKLLTSEDLRGQQEQTQPQNRSNITYTNDQSSHQRSNTMNAALVAATANLVQQGEPNKGTPPAQNRITNVYHPERTQHRWYRYK